MGREGAGNVRRESGVWDGRKRAIGEDGSVIISAFCLFSKTSLVASKSCLMAFSVPSTQYN